MTAKYDFESESTGDSLFRIGGFSPWYVTKLDVDGDTVTAEGICWESEISEVEQHEGNEVFVELADHTSRRLILESVESEALTRANGKIPVRFSLFGVVSNILR